jgi:surface antigen
LEPQWLTRRVASVGAVAVFSSVVAEWRIPYARPVNDPPNAQKVERMFGVKLLRVSSMTAFLALSAGMITGCAETQDVGTKQAVGTVGGAVLGGVIGSQFGGGQGRLWTTGIGAVLGAIAGSEVGKSLDRADKVYMSTTTQASLEHSQTGSTSTWQNPDSGNSSTVVPTRTYQQPDGQYCREFEQTVTIEGRAEKAYGTACRQPDGAWQIVS